MSSTRSFRLGRAEIPQVAQDVGRPSGSDSGTAAPRRLEPGSLLSAVSPLAVRAGDVGVPGCSRTALRQRANVRPPRRTPPLPLMICGNPYHCRRPTRAAQSAPPASAELPLRLGRCDASSLACEHALEHATLSTSATGAAGTASVASRLDSSDLAGLIGRAAAGTSKARRVPFQIAVIALISATTSD